MRGSAHGSERMELMDSFSHRHGETAECRLRIAPFWSSMAGTLLTIAIPVPLHLKGFSDFCRTGLSRIRRVSSLTNGVTMVLSGAGESLVQKRGSVVDIPLSGRESRKKLTHL